MSRHGLTAVVAVALSGLLSTASLASSPKSWHFIDAKDFGKGKLEGLALHATNGLSVTRSLTRSELKADFIHCWARDGSTLWLGTGLGGGLFRYSNGKSKLVTKLKTALIGALTTDGKDGVYAGLVGKPVIVHVNAAGKTSEVVKLDGAKHVWALHRRGNTLYAGTGPEGKIFAVNLDKKKAELYAETHAEHVLTMTADRGALIAGTATPAMLVRIDGKDKARAIANFPGGEVRSVVRLGKALYAAVNGGNAAAKWSKLQSTPKRPGKTKSKPPSKAKKKKSRSKVRQGKGSVWYRSDDGRIARLFISPQGMISQIAAHGRGVVAAAARGGRVMVSDLEGQVQQLYDLKEGQVLGVEMQGKDIKTLFTGNGAALYHVGEVSKKATYTTSVLRETGVAQWGRVEAVTAGKLIIETRSGFSNPVNKTWSAWAGLENSRITSPPASFLQVRVRFENSHSQLRELRIFRRVFNRAPVVLKVSAAKVTKKRVYKVSWKTSDPDKDKLSYRITYRKRGTMPWLMLHHGLYHKTSMMISPRDMPDGWYEFRVEASDEPVNSPSEARRTAKISKPVLVDQGRPEVAAEVRDGVLKGVASDRISRIVRVEVSYDGRPTVLAKAFDGVYDGKQEAFELQLPKDMTKGPHTLLIQASDEAGNTGVKRLPVGY
jgi:hypothetical protein